METIETVDMQRVEVETKEGYIKTKNGWIPKDWNILNLAEVATFYNGKAYKQTELLEKGKYKVLRVGNFFTKSEWYYSDLELENNKYVNDGDLMFAWSASFGPKFWHGEKTIYHYHIWKVEPHQNTTKHFLYNFLLYDVERMMRAKQGGTMFHITKGDIEKRKIPLPPLPEQKKIAEILFTWDVAIEQNQKLLEQFKLRKKGLMQQLLTGKKRLKGFDGEWKYLKGGELFSNHSNKNHDGTLTVLSATQDKGVIPRDETGIDIKYDRNSLKSYKKVEVGDFVISLRSFQGGIEYSNYEGLVSPAYTVLKEANPISKVFYKEYLKTDSFITRLNSIIYGIRDGKQISYKEFATLKIAYPALDEQQAIAKVLTAADAEIKTQETYLDKLQIQKRGLMQKLLTGEIRVNVN